MLDMASCAGDAEDTLWLSEGDKARGITLLDKAIERLRLQRNPCKGWEILLKRKRCMLD